MVWDPIKYFIMFEYGFKIL